MKLEDIIKNNFLSILDQTQTGIVLTDPKQQDNPIVYVNKYFEDLFGYSADEVIGINCRLLQKDDTEQEAIKTIREAVEFEMSVTTTVRNYTKNGKLIYNEVTVSPIYDENKQLIFFIGVQKDVTHTQNLLNSFKDLMS